MNPRASTTGASTTGGTQQPRGGAWCRVFGHRFRFSVAGAEMRWKCARHCGAGGAKVYGSAADALRYAAALDVEDRDDIGRRAPFLGMFPLRMWHRLRHRPDDRHDGRTGTDTGP